MLEAMRISGEVVTNLPMRDAVQDAATRVREGAPIGKSLGARENISADDDSPHLQRRVAAASWRPCWTAQPPTRSGEMDSILSAVVGLLGP